MNRVLSGHANDVFNHENGFLPGGFDDDKIVILNPYSNGAFLAVDDVGVQPVLRVGRVVKLNRVAGSGDRNGVGANLVFLRYFAFREIQFPYAGKVGSSHGLRKRGTGESGAKR